MTTRKRSTGEGPPARDRPDHHDMTRSLSKHGWQYSSDTVENSIHIHIHHALPVRYAPIDYWGSGHRSSIIHEDVSSTKFLICGFY